MTCNLVFDRYRNRNNAVQYRARRVGIGTSIEFCDDIECVGIGNGTVVSISDTFVEGWFSASMVKDSTLIEVFDGNWEMIVIKSLYNDTAKYLLDLAGWLFYFKVQPAPEPA